MSGFDDDLDPLTRLAIRHGTDKWGLHFYTPLYHRLFSHLRDKPVRLLEIGIGGYAHRSVGGASLAMWADYFPRASIVGMDVVPKTLSLDPRIKTVVGSQDDAAFLARLSREYGPFDIVIDDGSHLPNDVVATFRALFPRLADDALYVIEDVQTTFWPQYGGSASDGAAVMRLARAVLRSLNYMEIKIAEPTAAFPESVKQIRSLHAYHNLLVIEKGDNSEPSNFDYRLDNVHAARALRTIEQELAGRPTPEGLANLINLYALAGKADKAEKVASESLAKWPDHPALLSAASDAAERRGDAQAKRRYVERLMQLEPKGGTEEASRSGA